MPVRPLTEDTKIGEAVNVENVGGNPGLPVLDGSQLYNLPGGGSGDVVGPASSTDGAVALFDGTTGKLIKEGTPPASLATKEPNGFTDPEANVTISWSDASKVLTITPTGASFEVWVEGVKYTKTGAQTKDISATIAEGFWYFYYDNTGTLQASNTIWDFETKAQVAFIYWDATNSKALTVTWEPHSNVMDWTTHKYLHQTVGTRFRTGLATSGSTTGDGSLAVDAQIAVGAGAVHDEDLVIGITSGVGSARFEQDLALPAKLPVWYLNGSTPDWRVKTANSFPLLEGTARIKYNQYSAPNWLQTDAPSNGNYVAMWIFATNDQDNPVIAVLGQRYDLNLINAQNNNTFEGLNFAGIPLAEMKVLARLIFQTSTLYANTPHARLRDIEDYRSASLLPTSSFVATDHNSLAGRGALPAHPATALTVDTTNFDGALTAAEDTVQKVADKLDDEVAALKALPGEYYFDSLLDYDIDGALTANEVHYIRIRIPKGATLTEMRAFIRGGGSATRYMNLGIYDQADPNETDWTVANGKPRNRLAQTGQVDTNVAGAYRTASLTSPYTITANGFYWLALIGSSALVDWAGTLNLPAGYCPVYFETSTGTTLPATAGTLFTAETGIILITTRE